MFHMGNYGTCLGILVSLLATVSYAAPAALTYQGRIIRSNGTPLEYSAVAFQFEILAPNKVCVLYREQLNHVDMTNSGGVFDVKIGSSHSYPATPGFTILDAFNNAGPMVCDGNSPYNPGLTDGRFLRVKFHDGAQWQTISPDSEIRTVPFAGFASSAAMLGTNVATDFVMKNEVNGNLNCDGGSFLTWDAINKEFGCSGVSGASGGTVKTVTAAGGSNPYLTVSADTVNPAITLNVGTTAGTVAAGDDARFTNSRNPVGTAGGALSGNYPNPGLADNAVTTSKIMDGSISTAKLFANPGINRLVKTDSSSGDTLEPFYCSPGQVMVWNSGTGWTCANQTSLAVGSASVAANFTGSLGGDVTGTQSATVVEKIKGYPVNFTVAPTSGQILKLNASGEWIAAPDSNAGGTITALTGDVTASGSATVTATVNSVGGSSAASVNSATVAANAATHLNTVSTIVKRDTSGNFAAGAANLNSVVLRDSGSNTVTLQAPASVTSSYVLKLPETLGGANTLLSTDASGNLSWVAPTAATSVAVTAPITNSGTATAPNIGIQQANGSQAGYLSAADWTAFNAKQSTSLAPANIFVGNASSVATAVAPSGDVSMTNAGAFTVTKVQSTAVSATAPTAAGQVLRYNGTTQYAPAFLQVGDIRSTITPFGGVFANSACTTSQTMYYNAATDTFLCQAIAVTAANFGNQAQNSFFAGPSSGGAGAPAFRAIAAADLPTVGTTGTYRSVTVDAYGRVTAGTNPTTASAYGLTDVFVNGGNNFGANATLGTNSAHSLILRTNSNTRMTIDSSGHMGIGVAPTADGMLMVKSDAANVASLKLDSVASGIPSVDFLRNGTWKGTIGYADGATDELYITNAGSAPIVFDTNNAEKMRLSADGKLGIGIPSPSTTLHVNGSAILGSGNTTFTEASNYVIGNSNSITNSGGGNASTMAIFGTSNSISTTNMNFSYSLDVLGRNNSVSNAGNSVVVGRSNTVTAPNSVTIGHSVTNSVAGSMQIGINNTSKMTFLSTGYVGVNTTAPSEALEVNGNVKAASYLYTSDARLKKDVITLPQAMEKLLKLRGVNFVWKNNEEKTVGFIAQEVEAVYPELVKTDKTSGYKSVQYGNITAILVEALKQEHAERLQDKELCQSQIATVSRGLASVREASESRLQQLEKENQDLKLRLERLEQALLKGK